MQEHIQHNKDERTQFLRKIYLSLYLKGFERVTKGFSVWEVSWRRNRTATKLTPTLMDITTFLSPSRGLLNGGGAGGPASLGHGPIPASSLQLTWTSCRRGYKIIWRPPTSCECHNFALNSNPQQSRSPLISWYLRPDAPVTYTGAFLLLTAWSGRRSLCNNKWSHLLRCITNNLVKHWSFVCT